MIFRPQFPGLLVRARRLRAWRVMALLLIFFLGALTRLDFVLNAPQVPPGFSDQAGYQVAAETVVTGLRLQFPGVYGPPPDLAAEDAAALDRAYRQVFWDATARNGILPLLMVPAYLTDDPIRVLRVAQALLFATIPLAVVIIARRVTKPELAWLVGLLGAIYPPLIIATGRFLHQEPTAVVLVWALACLLAVRKRRTGPRWLVAGYALLTIAGYILLAIRPLLLVVMVLWPVGQGRRRIAKWAWLGGLALAIVLWSLTVNGFRHNDLGEELLKNSLGVSRDNMSSAIGYNLGAFVSTELWRTDDTFLPNVGLPERQDILTLFRADPANILGGILTNAYRFFLQPYNTFGTFYGLDYGGQVILHQGLLALAVVGTLVSVLRPGAGRGQLAWMALLLAGLLLAIYATTHIESRYRSILTPFQLILAGVGLEWLLSRARPYVRDILGGVWLFNGLVIIPILLAVFPAMTTTTAHGIDAALEGLGWAITAGVLVWAERSRRRRSGERAPTGAAGRIAPALTLLLGLGIALLVGGGLAWDPTWRGWTAVIAPGERVQQIVTLDGFTPPPGTAPVLLLDLGAPAQEPNLTIAINGIEVKPQWVPLQPWAATRGAAELAFAYSYDIFRQVSRGYVPDFRRWGFMPLDLALWADSGQIVIELIGSGMDPVTLWGDYADDPAVFVGPSLSPWDDSRSLFRLQWSKDDRRVTVRHDLGGISYFAQRGSGAGDALTWSEDLSAAPGLQTGRYRAYVLWLSPEEALPYTPP